MIKRVTDEVYHLIGPIGIGMIRTEKGLIIIDTGLDESYGRKILKASKELGEEIIGIINTHSHADHFGGNNFLKKRTKAWIIASRVEKALIENPIFEPMYLFGGVPFPEMRTKFLEGKPSTLDMESESEEAQKIFKEIGIEILEFPGHSPAHIGVIYKDAVFIGDLVMPEKIVKKYKLGYFYDVKNEKRSLEKIKRVRGKYFIPGHGDILDREGLEKLIELNLNNILEVEEITIDILSESLSTEEAFSILTERLGIQPDLTQILLLFSTFKGFLTELKEEGIIDFYTEKGKIMWKKRG